MPFTEPATKFYITPKEEMPWSRGIEQTKEEHQSRDF
jgi:hypothetical protein